MFSNFLSAGASVFCFCLIETVSAQDDPIAVSNEAPVPVAAENTPEQDEEGMEPTAISLTAEWIEVELGEMPKLLRDHGSDADSTALIQLLEERIEAGAASRIEVVYGRVPLGDRGKIESGEELIYPTEYDPPEIPNTVSLGDEADASQIPRTSATPAAYETRLVGIKLEAESDLVSSDRIRLKVDSKDVDFLGRDYHLPPQGKEGDDPLSVVWMPRFHSMEIQTTVTLKNGTSALLGSFRPPGETKAGKRWLFFVHAQLLERPVEMK